MLFSLIASFLALTIAHPTPDHPSGPVSNSAQLLEDLKPREVFPATPAYLFARELFSGRPADLDIQIWDQPNCPPRPKGNPTDFGSIINHHNYEGQPLKILSYSLNRTLDPREVLDFSNNINEVVGSLPPPPPSPTTPPPASPTVPCGEKGGGENSDIAAAGGSVPHCPTKKKRDGATQCGTWAWSADTNGKKAGCHNTPADYDCLDLWHRG